LGKADVIYINSQGLSSRSRLGLLGPLPGKKLVYHNPDFYDPFTYPWRYRLEGQLCRKADLYINNEFHRGYITKTLYQLSCPVITAPPNLPAKWPIPEQSQSRRRELTANEENAFVIIQHGPFTPLRTGEELLQALTHLPRRFRVAFTGGQATRDAVQPHVDRLKLQDRVTVLPRLPFNQMLSYTVNADAGLLLYSNNDLGNFFTAPGRLTEYLACGIPVIASNHTGLENLVLRVGAGEPVDSTTPSDIARGIEALANAKERGAYEAQHLKHAFSNTLAFENWENTIQESFNNLLEGIPIPTANPPFPWLRRQ
jgi:glycosyltransferase involved in cell wall biosynthesis